jgi:AraC-like DNA-binding protein
MVKSLQKSAKNPPELQLSHPGIIDTAAFNKHFALHCYQPAPDLRPFVVHIWTQRLNKPLPSTTPAPTEILSGPNAYMFFTPQATFIHGPAKNEFKYDLSAAVIAGVKFRPGGFYPFLRRPVSELGTEVTPASQLFPGVDDAFTAKLLACSDADMVRAIEALLREYQPKADKNVRLVKDILEAIAANNSLKTVSAIAQAFGMSERSLQLLFQTYVGVGVKWIITRQRLIEVIDRAQAGSLHSWVTAAAELGYSSQSHFSRDFKRATGISPSQYRKPS